MLNQLERINLSFNTSVLLLFLFFFSLTDVFRGVLFGGHFNFFVLCNVKVSPKIVMASGGYPYNSLHREA